MAGIIAMSCSEKRESGREKDPDTSEPHRELAGGSEIKTSEDEDESQPGKDDIEEDCAAFVSSTKVVPARAAAMDCPVGTIKTWIHRARGLVVRELKERGVVEARDNDARHELPTVRIATE